MPAMDQTQSRHDSVAHPSAGAGPWLFLVWRADRPLETPARIALGDVDVVRFGRGETRQLLRSEEEGVRVLRITLPDPMMSRSHARLSRVLGDWLVEDEGSKNGTFVDGRPLSRGTIADGSLLELGHAFLAFRSWLPGPAEAGDLDGPSSEAMIPTLLPALAEELRRGAAVARSPLSVLVLGESGSGKEVAARAVHRASGRSGPFVAINCAALPATLVESELFGYRKGAFSGAAEDREGLVRASDRGTLFLDEIGDLSPGAQAALLRVLQEAEVTPLGGTKPVPVDLRVIAATNRDLQAEVAAQRFRADLLARLTGYVVHLPALRDRREDFGLLAGAVLRRTLGDGASGVRFTPDAARALLGYPWPLNVRELEKTVLSAAVLAEGATIRLEHLPAAVRGDSIDRASDGARPAAPQDVRPPGRRLSPSEEQHKLELEGVLRETDGNVAEAARRLGKGRTQLQRWIARFGISVAHRRGQPRR